MAVGKFETGVRGGQFPFGKARTLGALLFSEARRGSLLSHGGKSFPYSPFGWGDFYPGLLTGQGPFRPTLLFPVIYMWVMFF